MIAAAQHRHDTKRRLRFSVRQILVFMSDLFFVGLGLGLVGVS